MRKKFDPRKGFVPPDNTPYSYRDGTPVDASPGYHPHASTRFRNWGAGAAPDIMGRELPELYDNRSECCGCTACAAVCPRGAITMEPDEEGLSYPVVDASLCVRCGKCVQACAFKGALVERWNP